MLLYVIFIGALEPGFGPQEPFALSAALGAVKALPVPYAAAPVLVALLSAPVPVLLPALLALLPPVAAGRGPQALGAGACVLGLGPHPRSTMWPGAKTPGLIPFFIS